MKPEMVVDGVIPNMLSHPDHLIAFGDPEALAELAEMRAEVLPGGGGYEPTEDFQFRMITYRMREVFCSQGQNLPSVAAKRPYNPLVMHPDAMRPTGAQRRRSGDGRQRLRPRRRHRRGVG